ncbi:MAG: glycosyltransferase family 4 protein [Saprospiraceae bacterium]|nr:glycosyltransferase family 4 protein [Saprospiraceae bacterium]
MKKIAILPFDPIDAYEQKGTLRLYKEYFNPAAYFDRVWVISPREKHDRILDGFVIKAARNPSHFRSLLTEFDPDVLRVYGGGWNADYAIANRIAGLPIIVSLHDTNPSLLSPSIQFADGIIAMSEVIKELAIKAGVQSEQIQVMGNRVNTQLFQLVDPKQASQFKKQLTDGRLILHIGRQCAQKNQDTLLRALPLLPADFSVVFVGQGDARPYQRLASELGVLARCSWIERIPNEELPMWYSASDVFCVPSRWEGFGIVFIEAAACESPIVSSNMAPMNEYLVHKETAWLVDDCEDPAALARGITFMATGSKEVGEITRQARQAALQFDKEKIDQLEAYIYRDFLQDVQPTWSKKLTRRYRFWRTGFLLRQHFVARKYRTVRDWGIRFLLRLYRQIRQPLTPQSNS